MNEDDFSFECQLQWLEDNGYLEWFLTIYNREGYINTLRIRNGRTNNIIKQLNISMSELHNAEEIAKEMENCILSSESYIAYAFNEHIEKFKEERPELWI